MATWIVHLRIADKLIEKYGINQKREFIIGSVSPDCGYGVKDSFGEFTPPPEVTHWAPGGVKKHCRCSDFSGEYLTGKQKNSDYYFYLAYYVHLLTDIMWSSMIYLPTKIKYADEYKKNPHYLKTIKQDWYDLDFRFLSKTPDFSAYKILKECREVKDYLPYYEENQLSSQVRYISDFYSDCSSRNIERDYSFLTEDDVNEFINSALEIIGYDLKRKNLI